MQAEQTRQIESRLTVVRAQRDVAARSGQRVCLSRQCRPGQSADENLPPSQACTGGT